jgi:hypothetical protein
MDCLTSPLFRLAIFNPACGVVIYHPHNRNPILADVLKIGVASYGKWLLGGLALTAGEAAKQQRYNK